MALKATIYKAQLQITDMDRGVYADHGVIIARHPSEADERMMIRLLAFALNVPADDKQGKLEFAKDLWDVDEPALWHKDYTDAVQHWIDVGQPDDKRLMRAAGRAERVSVYSFPAAHRCGGKILKPSSHARTTWWCGRSRRRKARHWPGWQHAACSCRSRFRTARYG